MMKQEKGFTLLEVVIAMALAALIAYAIFVVLRTSNEQAETSGAKMTIQDSAREGLYKMVQELRLSAPSHATILNGGNSIQFSIPDKTNPVKSDYTVDWTNAHQITYALGGTNNKQVLRTDAVTGASTVLANDVTSLNFAGDAATPKIITVTLGVQQTITNSRQITSTPLLVTEKAELRNS